MSHYALLCAFGVVCTITGVKTPELCYACLNCCIVVYKGTVGEGVMPSVRQLGSTFSPQGLRFSPGSVRVGFVANEVVLARGLLLALLSSTVSMTPLTLHTHISFITIDAVRGYTCLPSAFLCTSIQHIYSATAVSLHVLFS